MRRQFLFLLLALPIIFAGCAPAVVYRPTEETAPKMSFVKAQRTIKTIWKNYHLPHGWAYERSYKIKFECPKEIKFKKDAINLISKCQGSQNILFTLDITSMTDPYVVYSRSIYRVYADSQASLRFDLLSDATAFVNALFVLKHGANTTELAAEAAFEGNAKKYREMPVKPVISEDVERYRLMAEDAFKNKDFEKAAEYYEEGLEIQPLWPQGQYMAALIEGELKDYENAAMHMKRYLKLVPDAPNAKAAREKMLLWEGKAKEETSSTELNPTETPKEEGHKARKK